MRLLRLALFLLLGAPAAALATALPVKVMVLTAFPPELAPWLAHLDHPVPLEIAGAYAPVWCDTRAVCVTETGEGQINAAASVAAILASSALDLSQAVFLRAGIAGGPPWGNGTLGGANWADWVISWDFGYHLPDVSNDQSEPHFIPLSASEPPLGTLAFHLNPALVALAFSATKDTPLADDAAARAGRARYPVQSGRLPRVAIGASVISDQFWIGAAYSREAQSIVSDYTGGTSSYASSAEEDTGDAGALARRSLLSHYLSLRTISDYDQPPAGETAAAMALANEFPGSTIAVENAYRVAQAFIAYALANPRAVATAIGADTVPSPRYPLSATQAAGN
ncbi:MAG TPA: hypothetical protein VMA86_10305 [Acetobacteraceae bacterium]|nr:hypothetical protein [Acetobacteraceae bacterium]